MCPFPIFQYAGVQPFPNEPYHPLVRNPVLDEFYQPFDIETVTQEADREMYDAAASLPTKAGYDHYEILNFAMPSRRCRHNLFYWHNLSYLGFGSASVACVEGWRRKNVQHPAEYVSRMLAGESLVVEAERLGTPRVLAETLMLGLRLVEGVERSALEEPLAKTLE